MGDSERPKPFAPNFEVPDLDLEPVPRSVRRAPAAQSQLAASKTESTTESHGHGYSAPNLFEEEPFTVGSLSLDLDAPAQNNAPLFGSSLSFEDPGGFELEPTAQANESLNAQPSLATERVDLSLHDHTQGARAAWPSGRPLDPTQLQLDPVELVILADYGDVPKAIQLTPGYAYRVFSRQRELKQQLISISAECERAQSEREATLAELARTVRPAAERIQQFRRFFAPLVELEQVASQRGQALSSINEQLNAHSAQLDTEHAQLTAQISAEEKLVHDAERVHDEREAAAKRADAKLKRVHIEMRAVTQVAEQKLGPDGGQIPDAEAAQLALLRQRAEAIKPELSQAQAEFSQAKQALGQVRARLDALQQSARLTARKKQALGEHYQKEVQVRTSGMSESEAQQRAALADLGRAVLAAAGTVEVSTPWLERVRVVSDRADQLIARREMFARAIDSYDHVRVGQGVRLACTAIALIILLIGLKIVL